MYDYVRRQQELQPGMFLSRTFHWMEHGSRERQPSWTRVYARNASHDPLALSSSSLFAGPRAASKPASTLGSVLQRSAASLSPHRALLTFRRHRQHSDAAARPPSGFSGTFIPRRRGFTAPSGSQPPVFATPAPPNRSAYPNLDGEPGQAPGTERHKEAFQPITESETELCPSMQAMSPQTGTGTGEGARAAEVPVYAAADSGASIMPGSPFFSPRADEQNTEKANDLSFANHQPSSASPQLFSSFSPPLSPHPRTICHRARSLMHRVRSLKPNSGYNIDNRRQRQQQQQQLKRRQQDQQNQQQRSGVPLTIASVLCTFDNGTLPRKANNPVMQRHPGPPPRAAAGGASNSGTPSPPKAQLSPRCLVNGSCQPGQRRLPRSPLANPLQLENDSESDLEKIFKEQPPQPKANGAADTALSGSIAASPIAVAAADSSEDEDAVKCLSCTQYKGHEWIVSCERSHQLCFGCVQRRVRDLLAAGPVGAVRCPIAKCSAAIPSRYLRACLPPQRLQQLSASSKRTGRAVQMVRRSLGLQSPSLGKASKRGSVRRPGSANRNDDGFDAPLILEEDIDNSRPASCVVDEPVAGQALAQSMANLAISNSESRRSYVQRFAASMPVLAESSGSGTGTASASDASTTPPLMSELTHVGHASVDSVVMAATVAADSTVSLSPESVGSRLRRVPKAQENLVSPINQVDYSSGSQTTNNEQDSPQSMDSPLFSQQQRLTQQTQPQCLNEPAHHPASALYDYASYELDSYMQTPQQIQAASFVSSSSPISWQQPPAAVSAAATAASQFAGAHYSSRASSAFYSNTPPPVPPPLPLQFRASATWITPEQRYSGYTENMLLNATLFETIRRKPSPSNDEGSEFSFSEELFSPPLPMPQRMPVPQMTSAAATAPTLVANKSSSRPDARGEDEDEENAHGVYIPTWRRTEATDLGRQMPLWAGAEYGSQSGMLCEAAELNFDLYETLHRRR